jgi:hypothetical protein
MSVESLSHQHSFFADFDRSCFDRRGHRGQREKKVYQVNRKWISGEQGSVQRIGMLDAC